MTMANRRVRPVCYVRLTVPVKRSPQLRMDREWLRTPDTDTLAYHVYTGITLSSLEANHTNLQYTNVHRKCEMPPTGDLL